MQQNVGLTQHSGAKVCYLFINHIGTKTHKHVTQETRNLNLANSTQNHTSWQGWELSTFDNFFYKSFVETLP